MNWSEQELENLIASVESTLAKAEKQSKLSKADDEQEDPAQAAAPAEQAAPQEAAPEMEASPEEQAPAMDDGQSQEMPQEAAPEEGEQQLEGEQEQPLSDEELQQIYMSLSPEELERHYSVIREALSSHYGQEQQQPEMAAAPQEQAQPQMPEQAAPQEQQEDPMMNKSEDMIALQKKVDDQAQAIELMTKAFEVFAKPQRKSVTDIQFINKSEDSGKPAMSFEDTKKAAADLAKSGKLDKSERETVNQFFLSKGEGLEQVQKIIHSKGGK